MGTGPAPSSCPAPAPGSAFSTSDSTGASITSSNDIITAGGCSPCGTAQGGLNYNSREYWDAGYGPGWNDADEYPQLLGGSRNFAVRFGGAAAVWFDLLDDNYVARYGAKETLVHDTYNNLFILTWADGSRYEFHDADQVSYPAYGLHRMVAPGGSTVEVSAWTADGKIEEVLYKTTQATGSEYQKRTFEYWTDNTEAGRRGHVKSVTLSEHNGTSWDDVRIISYDYYYETLANSYDEPVHPDEIGNLKTITTQHWDGSAWMGNDTYYYRYYNGPDYDAETNPGYTHSLKRVLLPNAYAAAEAFAASQSTTVDLLSEEQIANFTCFYYEYDADHRVSKEVDFGQSNEYTITNTLSGKRDAYNTWDHKNVVTQLDGTTNTVYTNYIGAVLLSDLYDPDTGIHTLEYNRYDNEGRLVLTTDTSGFELYGGNYYDESLSDLVGFDGDSAYLSNSEGLFRKGVYYTSTSITIDNDTAGGVEGYLRYIQNLHGEQDSSPDTVAEFEYFAHEGYIKCSNPADYATAIPSTIYPIATYSTYLDENTLFTESYDYDWYTATYSSPDDITLLAIKQTTTTLPEVTAAQNGSDTPNTTKRWFDEKGNPTWSMDELGRVTYVQYDSLTGRITQTIQDVNSTQSYSLSPPSGYEGNIDGLHVTTDYQTDAFGRVTQTLGPEHMADVNGTATSVRTATWTFYDDANHETRSAQGYIDVSNSYEVIVGPISITLTDRDGRTTEQIQAEFTQGDYTQPGYIGALADLAAATIAQSDYTAWTTYEYSKTRLVASRAFNSIPTEMNIIDDGDIGYSDSSGWYPGWSSGYGYEGDCRYSEAGFGWNSATWTFTVDPDKEYQVFATWQANALNATDAPFTVLNDTTTINTVDLNQQQKPSDEYLLNCYWQSVGVFQASSGSLVVQLTDDANGRVVADGIYIVEADSSMYLKTTYGYEDYGDTVTDRMGRQNKTVSPDGTITRQVLDARGNVLETWMGTDDTNATDNDPTGAAATGNNMVKIASYTYDADGNTTESRSYFDDGATDYYATLYNYDWRGWLTDIRNPANVVTHYEYDNLGRTTDTLTYADTDEDYFTFDQGIITGTNVENSELRAKTESLYDTLGRVYESRVYEVDQQDAQNPGTVGSYLTSETWYDARGLVEKTDDPLDRETSYDYDGLGRKVKVTLPDPDGGGSGLAPWIVYAYDDAGNLTSITDRLSHSTSYIYDAISRIVAETDANGDTTDYTYNNAGRLYSLTDAEDNTTTWLYDDIGRVVEEEMNELSDSRNFEYDAAGNLYRETDRNDRVREYVYDFFGRVTNELWKNGAATVHEFTYSYDLLGKLLTASDSYASYAYDYDTAGRLEEETQAIDGLTPTVVLAYDHDDVGRLEQVATTIGGTADAVTDYFYDSLGRPASIQQQDGGGNDVAEKRVDFTYDDAGQWDAITRYADLAATDLVATGTYGYDATGRLTDLTYTKTTTLVDYDWVFDAASRMTQYVNSIDGTVDYTNDDAGQLTEADYDYQTDESYTYDDNGNRVTANGDTYVTGDNNQLLSDDTYRYAYDDEGNRTSKFIDVDASGTLTTGDTDITTYDWDYRNRLVSVEHFTTYANYDAGTSDQLVTYAYDHQNRLVGRTLDPDGTSGASDEKQIIFIHEDNQIALQFDKTGTGDLAAADLSHRYLWGQVVDQILADETVDDGGAEDVLWALTDHLNTVRDLVSYDPGSDATTVEGHITYDVFGKITNTPAVDILFGFTGRLLDKDTDLQNNLNRWYDAEVGRWLSEDPIGFDAGDMNHYRYVGNKPQSKLDPHGLETILPGDPGEPHGPDSPYHSSGPTKCRFSQTCEQIAKNMFENSLMLVSHTCRDLNDGNNRHQLEILDLTKAVENCAKLYKRKKCGDRDGISDPVPVPIPGPVVPVVPVAPVVPNPGIPAKPWWRGWKYAPIFQLWIFPARLFCPQPDECGRYHA